MAHDIDISSSIPSRQVLEDTPPRALKFLSAVGRYPDIRAALGRRGYDDDEHRRGWQMLTRVCGYAPDAATGSPQDPRVRGAVDQLSEWNRPGFRIAAAALKNRHPEQFAFVFEGLEAAQGPAAVLSVNLFLERLDALENAPDRTATRDADHAALATLAKRKIDDAERARLRGLVDVAQSTQPAPVESADHKGELIALHHWHAEWTEVAKIEIERRDFLIALGLLKRRKRSAVEEDSPPVETPPPAVQVSKPAEAPPASAPPN
jgi:hypothetical protein